MENSNARKRKLPKLMRFPHDTWTSFLQIQSSISDVPRLADALVTYEPGNDMGRHNDSGSAHVGCLEGKDVRNTVL